jgi:cold-inducible RNA-binding protein
MASETASEASSGARIYVGNLPWSATSADLAALLAQYGQVTSAQVTLDRITSKSRGFGFVEMADQADVARAVAALDGSQYRGRRLLVAEAREPSARAVIDENPTARPRGRLSGYRGGRYGGGKPSPNYGCHESVKRFFCPVISSLRSPSTS